MEYVRRASLFVLVATLLVVMTVNSYLTSTPPYSLNVEGKGGHTCMVAQDGSVLCWGLNDHGQLGVDPRLKYAEIPVKVSGIQEAVSVSPRAVHTCAVTRDSSVWCWGDNTYGQLGNGSRRGSAVPTKVVGMSNARSVAAGVFHTCALLADSRVKCWGYNGYGQLGDGTFESSNVPIPVKGLWGATSIAVGGDHNCVVLGDGGIKCWGWNALGQVGVGSDAENVLSPTLIPGLSPAVAVSNGDYHSCALLEDGSVWCWGLNGESGASTEVFLAEPQSTLPEVTLATSDSNIAVLRWAEVPDATAYDVRYGSAGRNDSENDARVQRTTAPFAIVAGLENDEQYWFDVTAVFGDKTGGTSPTVIVAPQQHLNRRPTGVDIRRTDGGLTLAWNAVGGGAAYNVYYAASPGVTPDNYLLLPRGDARLGVSGTSIEIPHAADAGELHFVVTAFYSGFADGQLGNGGYANANLPTRVLKISTATQIDAGYAHSCALLANGNVQCWGRNMQNQLGANELAASATEPVTVAGISGATDISIGTSPCAVHDVTVVSCWGPVSAALDGEEARLPFAIIGGPLSPTGQEMSWE